MEEKQLNILMYPWLSMGHISPYFQIAIKFAEKGHKVTLLLPNKAKAKLPSENPHPSLLILHGITVPHVDPLPLGTEINSEVSYDLEPHLFTALDLFRPEFESIISSLEPNLVFYDFAHWVPDAVAKSGARAKSVFYMPITVTGIAHALQLATKMSTAVSSETPAFPSSTETKYLKKYVPKEGLSMLERVSRAAEDSDILAFKSCREIEGKYCDFISNLYENKPALLAGMYHSEPKEAQLETCWADWLEKFRPSSVVFCSLGSQLMLNVAHFQELLLGLELTNLPFLAALKPPEGCASVEEAFPEGFVERTKGRGLVTGEWVPQVRILGHPSVGCFVSHCGFGGVTEGLMSKSQIVLIPFLGDQVSFTKLATQELKIAVEVKRSGEGQGSWSISQHDVCNAIKSVMDDDSEIGELVRHNLQILRQKIVKPGFMPSYIDNFIKDLQALAP